MLMLQGDGMTIEQVIVFVYWFWLSWMVIDTAKIWFNIKRLDDQHKQQLNAHQFDAWLKSSQEARKATPLYDAHKAKLTNFIEPQSNELGNDYPTDCNNSPALTSELPLSDESRQWIAKDTCSGREYACTTDALDTDGLEQLIAHQQKNAMLMMEQSLKESWVDDVFSESTIKHLRKYATVEDLPCSSAHTPTAEPQTTTELGHIPAVKGMDI